MPEQIDERFRDAGKIASLWARSNLHSSWNIQAFEKYVQPPILNGQYLLLQSGDGMPLAYASWALMSVEVEARYLDNPTEFYAIDWQSGDRLWFMDWVSPYGKQFNNELVHKLKFDIFPNAVARSLHVRKDREQGKVAKFIGANVSTERSRELFAYYRYSLREISQSGNIVWEKHVTRNSNL